MSIKCEICNLQSNICVKHHIVSKSSGGKNTKDNIVIVCPNCHSLIHLGEIILEGKFLSTAGYKLVWRKKGEKSKTGIKDPNVYVTQRRK